MSNELLRIGDRERNEAVSFLQTHAEQGRLSIDEFGDRVGAVNAARTFGDLAAIFQDLPSPKPRDPALPMSRPTPAPAPGYGTDPYGQPIPYAQQPPYGPPPRDIYGPPMVGYRKYNSIGLHILLFLFTAGIGNIIYAWYVWDCNTRHGY